MARQFTLPRANRGSHHQKLFRLRGHRRPKCHAEGPGSTTESTPPTMAVKIMPGETTTSAVSYLD